MASRSTNNPLAAASGQRGGGITSGRLPPSSSPPSGINESTNQSIQSAVLDEHNPFLSASFPIDTAPPSRPPNPPPPPISGDIEEDIHRFEGESMQGTQRSKHIGRQSTPMEDVSPAPAASSSLSMSPPSPDSGKSRLRSLSDDTIDRLKSIFYSPHTSTILGNSRLMASKTFSMTKNAAGVIAAHPMTQSHLLSAKKMLHDYKQSVPIYYQLLTALVLFTHVLWPLLYFWSAFEARAVIYCSLLHLLISHLLYYQYQRLTCTTITLPALLWIVPALYLFIRPGVGEELSVELAIALHNAHVSPRHVLGLYEVFSSRWYSFLLWYRFALITTSALLPFVILHNIHHYSYHFEDLQNINSGFAMPTEENQPSAEEYLTTPAPAAPSAGTEASEYFEPNQSELVKHQRKPTVSVSSIRAPFQSPLPAPINRSTKDKQFFSDTPPEQPASSEMMKENQMKNEQEQSVSGTGLTESKGVSTSDDRQQKKEMIHQPSADIKGEKPSGTVGLKPNKPSDTVKESSNIGAQHDDATAIKKENTATEKMAGPAPSIRSMSEKTN